jgi:Carboxypeptidase regulatory-like domain
VARSDQNGWWTCAVIDPKDNYSPDLIARHPDFAPASIWTRVVVDDANKGQMAPVKPLWSGRTVTTMVRGLTLKGRVLDDAGQAVARAQVVHDAASMFVGSSRAETGTSAEGSFVFRGLAPGDFDFIVTAPRFAQEYRKVSISNGIPPVEVRLKPGGLIRLRVVDQQGDAVPNARAALTGLLGAYAPECYWSAESGPDGRIEWNSAPTEQVLNLCASKPGWLMTRGIMVKADWQEHTIKLRRALLVTGRVTDADTGETIQEVKAFPGYGGGDNCWWRGDTWRSTNDTFQVRFTEEQFPWRVCVEAEGYAPFVSRPLPRDFSGPLDVALHRPDPSKAVRGVVLRPDGQAASGAEVALLTLEHGASLGRAHFAHREPDDKLIINADADGHFVFSPDPAARKVHTIIAVSGDGFARVRVRDPKEPLTICLQPWGRVEVTIDPSARRRPVHSVEMNDRTAISFPGSLRLDGTVFRMQPGESDHFAFDFVPPETFCVWLNAGTGIPYPEHHHTRITVSSGTTTQVMITETGYIVKGRLVAIGGEGDWTRQVSIGMDYEDTPMLGIRIPSRRFYASRFAKLIPDVPRPEAPPGSTYESSVQWAVDYWSSEAARGSGQMNAILSVSEDGSFESLEGVQPGNYRLKASVNGKSVQRRITVFNLDEITSSVVDLGDVPVGDKTTSAGPVAPTATGLNQ